FLALADSSNSLATFSQISFCFSSERSSLWGSPSSFFLFLYIQMHHWIYSLPSITVPSLNCSKSSALGSTQQGSKRSVPDNPLKRKVLGEGAGLQSLGCQINLCVTPSSWVRK